MRPTLALLVLLAVAGAPLFATGDADRIAQLERDLAAVQAALSELEVVSQEAIAAQVEELRRQVEILAAELERLQLGTAAVEADEGRFGLAPAASKVYRTNEGLSIGGYGEMLYERFDGGREDGAPSGKTDQLDFLRAIVYFGYKFDDRWIFNSEIEVEHTSSGADGEVSLEFAYLDFLWRPEVNLRTGLLLVPMGLVNELHEPTVFLTTERPETERRILPSTWRENGLGLFGEIGALSYRAYLLNGLDATGFSSSGLRGGRQKGSKARAEDLAFVGRVDIEPTLGVLLGGSFYLGNSGQGLADERGRIDALTTLWELHAEWRARGFQLRGLWAQGRVDDAARLSRALDLTPGASVATDLQGGYLQLGYDLLARRSGDARLVPFVQYEAIDTQAGVAAGARPDPAQDAEILTLGVSFQPIDRVVFKLDWADWSTAARSGVDQFNLAIGYVF